LLLLFSGKTKLFTKQAVSVLYLPFFRVKNAIGKHRKLSSPQKED